MGIYPEKKVYLIADFREKFVQYSGVACFLLSFIPRERERGEEGERVRDPSSMASSSSSSKSLIQSAMQTFKRFFRKPWEITGPCAHPEYRASLPRANEYRRFCPATPNARPVVPTANPENVYDIKYFTRDRRRDLPPKRVTVYRKEDVLKEMREKKTFDVSEFPRVFLMDKMVQKSDSLPDGGYQK